MSELETFLRSHKVGPEIIERVLRLNPSHREGEKLRGWHYKRFNSPSFYADINSKGWVIRKHGRAVFDRIPREAHIKRGRRVYVSAQELCAVLTQ